MTTGRQSQVFQQLRQAVLARDGAGLTDAELMTHFVGRRDGAALEALIRRHGSMVWSVCRRVLSNEQDAEDAFQASFLVFVRKAASIRARQQVGNWLYGTAYRTALKARTTDARRRAKERRAAKMAHPQAEAEAGWSDLLPLLDQELSRLPDKYRTAIVLCELEGRPRKEAARQLGIPEGTLSSRLATGRRMLAKRLGRPGLALSAGALATGVPPPLLASTVKAVTLIAAGQATIASVVSVRVAALAEGVVKAMFLSKFSVGAALLVVVGVLAAGAGGVAYCAAAADPKPQPQTAPVAAVQPTESNGDKGNAKGEEPPQWGEAVDGVQARLRPKEARWDAGAPPEFILDMRNQGEKKPYQCRVPNFCMIEWDGKWYRWGGSDELDCKSSVLEPGKQIDDWVKVSLKVPWLNGRPASIKGSQPLEISAGKHKLRVSFQFDEGFRFENGPKTEVVPNIKQEQGVRVVSQLVNVEVGKESAWGEAVDGVEARIRTPKIVWTDGEAPTFSLDLRNQGRQRPHGSRIPFDAEIEVDGTWYLYGGPIDIKAADMPLPSNRQIDDWVKVTPDAFWVEESPGPVRGPKDHLALPPGKHTVRFAFKLASEKPMRPISGPIEIEIVNKENSTWGEAVDGVQARIRTPRVVWKADETPKFILDLRNQGKKTPDARRVPLDPQIEVDGTWYSFDLPAGPYPSIGDLLKPGEQVNDWTTASPDKLWGSFPGKKSHFPLPPGKHTVRIGLWLQFQDGTPKIRPVSGPIEIEVEKESAPDKPSTEGAKVPPAEKAAPGFSLLHPSLWQTAVIRQRLGDTIHYELAVDTTLDKALDQLLARYDIPWTVNTAAFGADYKDIVKSTIIEKFDEAEGVTRAAVLKRLLAKIPNDRGKTTPIYLVRPDHLEITTRAAYLAEFYPDRKPQPAASADLPPLAYAAFDQVPLADALAELAYTTEENVVVAGYAAKEAQTKVSARLTGVPLDAAVTVLADMADLKCVRVGNIYYVTTPERARQLEKEEQERPSKKGKDKAEDAPPPAPTAK